MELPTQYRASESSSLSVCVDELTLVLQCTFRVYFFESHSRPWKQDGRSRFHKILTFWHDPSPTDRVNPLELVFHPSNDSARRTTKWAHTLWQTRNTAKLRDEKMSLSLSECSLVCDVGAGEFMDNKIFFRVRDRLPNLHLLWLPTT